MTPCSLLSDYLKPGNPNLCHYCSHVCDAVFPAGCTAACINHVDELKPCGLMNECPYYAEPTPERTYAIRTWQR